MLSRNIVRSVINTNKSIKKSYSTDNYSDEQWLMSWGRFPPRRNRGINFLSAGRKYVVERFGKFHSIKNPGLTILIPFVDKISYMVDEREICFRINPSMGTTSDNIMVSIGGNLYVQFTDAYLASYGAKLPIYSVIQFAQATMRTAIGNFTLDKLFSERNEINKQVKLALDDGTKKWGCDVIRFEITDLTPTDKHVSESLHKQATAERERREKIITAEANYRETQLNADAYKYKQIQEAVGDAEKNKIQTDAQVYFKLKNAEADKQSIEIVGSALYNQTGIDAMKMKLTDKYFDKLGDLGGKSTTLIIPQNLSSVTSMLSVADKLFTDIDKKNN